ncbi:MAG: DciA family protein [Pseudomonadota bacterium]|nr:DciA family protein [Pseudomonadota bacterium]
MKQPLNPQQGKTGHLSGGLRSLQQKIARLENLTQQILPLLPSGERWQVASYESGVLCIAVAHHAAASRLRYLQQHYIEQIKTKPEFADLHRLKVIVETLPSPRTATHDKLPTLSLETKQILFEAASLFDDPELNQALLRIASKK